jgi:hypothetical protein
MVNHNVADMENHKLTIFNHTFKFKTEIFIILHYTYYIKPAFLLRNIVTFHEILFIKTFFFLQQKSVSQEVHSEKPKSTGAIPKSISFDKTVKTSRLSNSDNNPPSPTTPSDWQDGEQGGPQVY